MKRRMSVPFSTLATAVVGISLIHSLVPHHWLPFVIVGRKKGWDTKKTISLLSIGALVHMASTVAVGLLVGYLGHTLDSRFESYHGIIPGLVLFAFGLGYLASSFGHHRHEPSEGMAASSLILMLGLSPCIVVAPFFIMVGPLGWPAVVKISVIMSVLSLVGMSTLGWLATKGLDLLKLDWLERNESRVMGSLLILLGISFIIL